MEIQQARSYIYMMKDVWLKVGAIAIVEKVCEIADSGISYL
jgi:hypothetical protein